MSRSSLRQPRSLAALVLAFLASSAYAELSEEPMLGPGVRTRPAYDGSNSRRTELVPVVRYYGNHWFARSTQGVLEGGLRMELARGLHAGAQLAYEPGRKSSESDFLKSRGIADVDVGASLGAHVEWDTRLGPMPLALLARARQHVDSDRGAQADARLSAGVLRQGRLGVGVFTQATWGSAKSANSFYGVTPQQSASSGLPAFNAGSGLLHASYGLLWSFDLGPKWIAAGNVESRHLRGDAAASPLAERRSGSYASAGIAWRF